MVTLPSINRTWCRDNTVVTILYGPVWPYNSCFFAKNVKSENTQHFYIKYTIFRDFHRVAAIKAKHVVPYIFPNKTVLFWGESKIAMN